MSSLGDLEAKVVGEEPKITLAEGAQHLLLEPPHDICVASSDDKVVDVYAHDQAPITFATGVHPVFVDAAREPERQ